MSFNRAQSEERRCRFSVKLKRGIDPRESRNVRQKYSSQSRILYWSAQGPWEVGFVSGPELHMAHLRADHLLVLNQEEVGFLAISSCRCIIRIHNSCCANHPAAHAHTPFTAAKRNKASSTGTWWQPCVGPNKWQYCLAKSACSIARVKLLAVARVVLSIMAAQLLPFSLQILQLPNDILRVVFQYIWVMEMYWKVRTHISLARFN